MSEITFCKNWYTSSNSSKKIISGLISLVEVTRVFLSMEQDTCRLALISDYMASLARAFAFNCQHLVSLHQNMRDL